MIHKHCSALALAIALCIAVSLRDVTAQRIGGITSIEAMLDYSQNDPLDDGTTSGGTTTRQTTVLDVFVRPELREDTAFRFNVTTLSTSGEQGTDLCDKPRSDGTCSIATPVAITISASKLVQRYALRLRRAIPYLYYHRRFISCDGFTAADLTSTSTNVCFDAERFNAAQRAECLCRTDMLATSNVDPFSRPDDFRYSFATFDPIAIDIGRMSKQTNLLEESVVLRDYSRNASLYFNAVERSERTGVEYTPPPPRGDVDGSTLYVLNHIYDKTYASGLFAGVSVVDYIGRVHSNYVGRATGPLCYVYDIDAIPEQVLHVTVAMTPIGRSSSEAETLELSTINEYNGGLSTSGSSRNINTGKSGGFTARIENLQSPSSSFGPSLGGSIVMCPDSDNSVHTSFINTVPVDARTDVTVNPWREAFRDDPENARGRVFDPETISLLRNREGALNSQTSRAGIYYYSNAETNTVGEDCGQVGVTNKVYAGVPAQMANLVTAATVQNVGLDLIRGNESSRTALPSCFPGFGPSVARDTPLPGRMQARQKMYTSELETGINASIPQPPHVPPVFNARDPNVYFIDRYMYFEPPGVSDVEAEVIITVSGSFLSVAEQRSAGSIVQDASYCAVRVLNGTGETVGQLSALVCNDAERVQASATAEDAEATDDATDDANDALSAQFTVQAECPETSGVRVVGGAAGSATQITFTRVLEPGVCQRVDFNVSLIDATLDPQLSFCNVDLISNSAAGRPSDVFLDRVQLGCSLTANYVPPPTTNEGNISTTLSKPPGPNLLEEEPSTLDHLGILIVLIGSIGFFLVSVLCQACILGNYYLFTDPQLSKHI